MEKRAFENWVRSRYEPTIRYLMGRYGLPRDVADETTNEACFAVWKKASQDDDLNHDAYLRAVVVNMARRWWRERIRYRDVVGDIDESAYDAADDDEEPLTRLLEEATRDEVRNAISQLPEELEELIRLMYFEEWRPGEIAFKNNWKPPNFTYHKKRALCLLRQALTKDTGNTS